MSVLDQFRLGGKTALVTGAASGLGAAIAVALAEAGATVVCHGNRRSAAETVGRIVSAGGMAHVVSADLSESSGAENLFAHASKIAAIDILVNNAGTIHRAVAEEFGADEWDRILQVNLTSLFRLCQLAGTPMLERRQGKIINIASLLTFQGGIRVTAYAASKGAVAQLTKSLANEWAGRGVNVNAIAPGYFKTENTAALQADAIRNQQILERIPAERWGEPEDISGAAVFLASRASNYIHGEVLVVDGGWMGR